MNLLRVLVNVFPYFFYIGMIGVGISNWIYDLGVVEGLLLITMFIGMFGWLICVAAYFVVGSAKKKNMLNEVLESTNPFIFPTLKKKSVVVLKKKKAKRK